MAEAVSVRLDDEAVQALRTLEAAGMSRYEAIRSALIGADPDEYDRLRRRVLWKMPSGLYVVGSTDKGERRNGMTLN